MIELAFRQRFGIAPAPARVLAALWRAPGGLSADDLAQRTGLQMDAVKVHVHYLRRGLPEGAVVTRDPPAHAHRLNLMFTGEYRLTDAGRAECAHVLRGALAALSEALEPAA